METDLILEWPVDQLAYWRESDHLPEHATRLGFSINSAGEYVRVWFIYAQNAWLDGIEPPLDLVGSLINPRTIQLNRPTTAWDGKAGRLRQPPARWLAQPIHRTVTIRKNSFFQRLCRWLA